MPSRLLADGGPVEALVDGNDVASLSDLLDAEVDVTGIEPLSGGAQMAMRLREDVVTDGNIAEQILANAPDRSGNFFAVPKVVE